MSKRVVVGMSGGVDSSIAAALLKERGFDVIGLFMHNWKEEDEGGCCSAESDYSDVRDVCNTLDIPYYTVDFSKEYYDRVFRKFVEDYGKGRTPNPDVLCNREIKFDVFLEHALKIGADLVATGHYCKVRHCGGRNYLIKARDANKDQTYFLNQVRAEQLEKVIFPVGGLDKSEVRSLAAKYGLSTAEKKDSTGVCFIGERNFRAFLSQYIPMKRGLIKTTEGKVVGEHNGVFYYTLGQRRGLGIGGVGGGDGRWFVIDKDVAENVLYVSQGDESALYSSSLETDGFNFISYEPPKSSFPCTARIRHRQPEQDAVCTVTDSGVRVDFARAQRAIVAGQYVALYVGDMCIGGGEIV